ncbi:uncharacterized protein LOC108091606 isoform X2 [Drosophila ficusphila]|uniref:uncharacterized protein LOC108091606 isoform X2 n=1 Tax=Drosophila ficusphila TaxID=30025 RepID=UPI0007E6FCB3|nr:uncharacterized protein LOC108091606 isoform X2 [Drosophila ficusphila]
MCKKLCFLKRCNIKYWACIFWAFFNIVVGFAVIPLAMEYVKQQSLPVSVLVIGCICGANFILSGFMLLIGVLKSIRCLVFLSIVFCGMGIFFIHWLIIPLLDLSPDDRYKVPRRFL